MMRSLYSGVSGLKVHQTKMDVVGNNIANVNTVGFKTSRVTFTEVFSQTTQSATGANADTGRGGVNAMQIGLGSSVGSIYSDPTSEGASQRTDNPYDLKISGDNFFIVNDGSMNYFTKVGAFTTDSLGDLVTQSGMHVMGWGVDSETNAIRKDMVQKLEITTAENSYSAPEATKANYFSGNIDKTNTDVTGSGLTTTMTIYDKQGYSYTVKYNIVQDATDDSKYSVTVSDILDSTDKSIIYDATKNPTGKYDVKLDGWTGTTAANGSTTYAMAGSTSGAVELKYNPNTGAFDSVAGQDSFRLLISPNATSNTGGTNPFVYDSGETMSDAKVGDVDNRTGIDVDFSKSTMYASSGKTSIASVRGNVDGNGAGRKVGELSGVSIGTDGKIYGTYDNGDSRLLGQIAVTSFANPAGLEKIGDSLYQTTQNSGSFDGIGQDPTSGGGSVTQGVLEMSNVDLSTEFTEMITTQRGFQANSRVITTSDSMLEELVNLKR